MSLPTKETYLAYTLAEAIDFSKRANYCHGTALGTPRARLPKEVKGLPQSPSITIKTLPYED